MALPTPDLLKVGVLGAAALAVPIKTTVSAGGRGRMVEREVPEPFTTSFAGPPTLTPFGRDDTDPMTAAPADALPAASL